MEVQYEIYCVSSVLHHTPHTTISLLGMVQMVHEMFSFSPSLLYDRDAKGSYRYYVQEDLYVS